MGCKWNDHKWTILHDIVRSTCFFCRKECTPQIHHQIGTEMICFIFLWKSIVVTIENAKVFVFPRIQKLTKCFPFLYVRPDHWKRHIAQCGAEISTEQNTPPDRFIRCGTGFCAKATYMTGLINSWSNIRRKDMFCYPRFRLSTFWDNNFCTINITLNSVIK